MLCCVVDSGFGPVGFISASGFGPRGPNPRGVQIREGSKSAGIVYQWTQTSVSGFIVLGFKVLKSTSFTTKESECLPGKF